MILEASLNITISAKCESRSRVLRHSFQPTFLHSITKHDEGVVGLPPLDNSKHIGGWDWEEQ
eukprot:scaffold293520_cov65-Attheya_sp.AAC.1